MVTGHYHRIPKVLCEALELVHDVARFLDYDDTGNGNVLSWVFERRGVKVRARLPNAHCGKWQVVYNAKTRPLPGYMYDTFSGLDELSSAEAVAR